MLRELATQSALLTTVLDDYASSKGLTQGTTSDSRQAAVRNRELPAQSSIDIRAYTPASRKRRCKAHCRCKCHTAFSFKSAPFLKRFIGSIFIGYYGNPFNLSSKCTITSCKRQVIFGAYVHYYFPFWFLLRALDIELISTISQEPMISLVVRGVQLTSARILKLLKNDDVTGVQEQLSCGLVRPNDVFIYHGISLLQVSYVPGLRLKPIIFQIPPFGSELFHLVTPNAFLFSSTYHLCM